jgi:hypothetical protein
MAWTIRQTDDFAGWPVWGWLSPGGIASIRCTIGGHSDPHAGRIDVHIAPAVGAAVGLRLGGALSALTDTGEQPMK